MEYALHINSGFFSFGENSATKSSFIIENRINSTRDYTNNPYGKSKGLSYGFSAQVQRITKNRIIFGLQAGYESLRSHVSITEVAVANPTSDIMTQAHGTTTLKNNFVTVYPNIGHRFPLSIFDLDFTIGPEIGWNVNTHESGKATLTDQSVVTTDLKRHRPGTDLRLRTSLTLFYHNFGITTGYSYGFHNYTSGMIGANIQNYARYLRLGFVYKIK